MESSPPPMEARRMYQPRQVPSEMVDHLYYPTELWIDPKAPWPSLSGIVLEYVHKPWHMSETYFLGILHLLLLNVCVHGRSQFVSYN